MIFRILDQILAICPEAPVALVVGVGREQVESTIRAEARFARLQLSFIHQAEQKGTGHAARCAMDSEWGSQVVAKKLPVLILPGDLPLIPETLVAQMIEPLSSTTVLRLLSCELPDPKGYGRVVRRGKKGPVLRIVEEKDANVREKAIQEVAASIYLFQASFLRVSLGRLSNKNAQGEYYLTDLVAMASRGRKKMEGLIWSQPEDLRGVNDPWELAQADRTLNLRIVEKWARQGVRFTDPWSTRVDASVVLSAEVEVHRGAILTGSTQVAQGTVVGPYVQLRNMKVGEAVVIKQGTVAEDSVIAHGAMVGPYAHLRPESWVGKGAKIGNFVELKKTRIGERTSIAHLSYLGDAEVGERVNIGCGFVTCNFDGRVIDGSRKHKTVIEDDAFIGSDCQTVAPVTIGRGAYVASGSTITEEVPAEALAIARSRQTVKPGRARRLRSSGNGEG